MKYFGTDGFRGRANEELTVDHAFKIGKFVGWYYGLRQGRKTKAVIGKDTRRSSYMYENALVAGLVASGADAYVLRVTTTPSVSYVVRHGDFDCGIMITASHNPYHDNGIKLIDSGGYKMSPDVLEQVEAYIEGQHTYFVLENLDTLRKNGRLTGIKSIVASALNIKPVMGSTPEGTICQLGQARGMKRALAKRVEQVARETKRDEGKVLGIAHCNCPERAREVERMLLDKIRVSSSFIVDTAGISTMYANDGGIIVVI